MYLPLRVVVEVVEKISPLLHQLVAQWRAKRILVAKTTPLCNMIKINNVNHTRNYYAELAIHYTVHINISIFVHLLTDLALSWPGP